MSFAVAMGGGVAEELFFGPDNVVTGAFGDLQHVCESSCRLHHSCGLQRLCRTVATEFSGATLLSA